MMQLRLSQSCGSPSSTLRSSEISSAYTLCYRKSSCCPPSLHFFTDFAKLQSFQPLSRGPVLSRTSTHIVSADASRTVGEEEVRRSQVSKRLEEVGYYLKRVGTLSFWGQLVCTVVSAVILVFSVVISGTPTAQATFYLTAGGITAAFISVFWAYGYIRLSKRLRSTVHELTKAPPRADVVNQLKNGVIINLLGMGLTLLGMEATVGALVAKSLLSTTGPTFQGMPAGYSPVLALDVFLVQASANAVVSHFLGLASSLELLRAVNKSPSPESVLKPA
ncbi:hypothetical protein L7F22_029683 [Adiantum nelumboides]|nr:hypothetical protein [Adiantum nelumboides]